MGKKEILDPPVDWVTNADVMADLLRDGTKIGFTLTGFEANPSVPQRIRIMRRLQVDVGIPTFAKVEPITDFAAALTVILDIADFCKDIRIGMPPPHEQYHFDRYYADRFARQVISLSSQNGISLQFGEGFTRFSTNNENLNEN